MLSKVRWCKRSDGFDRINSDSEIRLSRAKLMDSAKVLFQGDKIGDDT